MESILTVFADTKIFHGMSTKKTAFLLTFTAFLLSLIYATDAGLIFLDTIDYYINFVMLLVGGFECFSAGWVYGIEKQIESLGAPIVFTHMCTFFGSVIVACGLWFGLSNAEEALWAGFVGLASIYFIGMTVVSLLMHKRLKKQPERWTWKSMTYELMFKNIADLKTDLSSEVGYLPLFWALLVKFFIPPVILVLFGLSCAAENEDGTKVFGHYAGYVKFPYQVLGVLCVAFTGFLFLSSLVAPQMYNALQLPEEEPPKRSSSAVVHVEPEKIDIEKSDPSRTSENASRSSFAESMKPSKSFADAMIWH